jgi:hypothetical protein
LPKFKQFIPLQSQTSDSTLGKKHQLARLLIASELLEVSSEFVQLAISQSLGPFFLHRLKHTETVLQDPTQIQVLKADARENMVLHLIQERAMFEVNQALLTAGIKCVWLTGVALGHTLYLEPHLRVKGNLDCVVPVDEFPTALEIIKSLHYQQPETLTEFETHDDLSQHIHLIHDQYSQLHLKLHQCLSRHSRHDYVSSEHLSQWLEQAVCIEINKQTFFMLKPEHHLLYLCGHGFLQYGESFVGIRDLLDLHLLLTTVDLDWELLITEAVELHWAYLVTYVFNLVRDYFDTPIPPDVFDALYKQNRADEFMNRIVLQHNSTMRDESILQYLSQLSFSEKIKTIVQIIFPPKRYIRQLYSIRAQRATAPYYVYRILDQLRRAFVAILRRLVFRIRRMFPTRSS